MSYIGRDTDKISNVEVLDNITFDGSSSYTLQKNSVNFTPSSANTLLVSIDGVVQAGNFTISGSTIDFGTAVAGTSTCDFILHYGTGLITTPADGTVTTAKIGSNAVTTAKIADANVTSAKMFSGFANGITEADAWYLTTTYTATAIDDITTNLARVNWGGFNKLGTGMTESSGIFTFPSTGFWKIEFNTQFQDSGTNERSIWGYIQTTTDNSTYVVATGSATNLYRPVAGVHYTSVTPQCIFDVTNTSTHKVKFSAGGAGIDVRGTSSGSATQMRFIKLGDT